VDEYAVCVATAAFVGAVKPLEEDAAVMAAGRVNWDVEEEGGL
jgi:hypothetical protein